MPIYVRCPPITDESHHKLSKRSGCSSSKDPLRQGFTSQAVVNYVAPLGWSPGNNREVFTLGEMVKEFDYHHISKSPAVSDMTKLKWMNGEYTKAMDFGTFYEMAKSYLKAAVSKDLDLKRTASMIKARIEVFLDTTNYVDFFETFPGYDAAMYTHKRTKTNPEISLKVLEDVLLLLGAQGDFTNDAPYDVPSKYVKDTGVKTDFVMWPVRTTVPGKQVTPAGATEIMKVLGKEEFLARVRKGIQVLKAQESSKWHLTTHKR